MNGFGDFNLVGVAGAIGIGLMIGLERERVQEHAARRTSAGIRTFTLIALLGALSLILGAPMLITAGALVGLLAVIGYLRSNAGDPGMTTEVALVLTFMLGALAMTNTAAATALGVVVTILLAARTRLHRFVHQVITEQELHDGLLLAAAALVILPMTPDHVVGPYGVLNPRTLWRLAVLVMVINAAGYLGLRMLGPRLGLSFAGFSAGFVSSTATIGAMGARATQHHHIAPAAVAGAVLSSVATVLELAMVIGATSAAVLLEAALPLLCAGATAVAYGAYFAWPRGPSPSEKEIPLGRVFDPRIAILFTATIGGVLMIASALAENFGASGLLLAAAASGLADAHAASAAATAVAASGKIPAAAAVLPILLAFTTNSGTKIVVAFVSGGRSFGMKVAPGVVLMVAAAWGGVLLQNL